MENLHTEGHCVFCGGCTFDGHKFCTNCGALVIRDKTLVRNEDTEPFPLFDFPKSLCLEGHPQFDRLTLVTDEAGDSWCSVSVSFQGKVITIQVIQLNAPGKNLRWTIKSHGLEEDGSLFNVYGAHDEFIGSCNYYAIGNSFEELRAKDLFSWNMNLIVTTGIQQRILNIILGRIFGLPRQWLGYFSSARFQFQSQEWSLDAIQIQRIGTFGHPWFILPDFNKCAEYVDYRILTSLFVLASMGLWNYKAITKGKR